MRSRRSSLAHITVQLRKAIDADSGGPVDDVVGEAAAVTALEASRLVAASNCAPEPSRQWGHRLRLQCWALGQWLLRIRESQRPRSYKQ